MNGGHYIGTSLFDRNVNLFANVYVTHFQTNWSLFLQGFKLYDLKELPDQ